jgi:hypothetical protein
MPVGYEDIGEEWVHVPRSGMYLACCDCSLVHFVRSRVRNGRVELWIDRMERETKSLRKKEGKS